MKPSIYRRIRRRPASRDIAAPKKDNQQDQQFFGETTHEPFFKPVAANQQASVQRKCADCEKEDKVQRSPDKKEEKKKLHRMPEKKEEEKIHKKEDKKEEEKIHKKEEKIHKKEGTAATANASAPGYISSISGKGQSMDAGVRSFYENKMGADFSEVKIHTGKEAAESAKDINAQAYAYGNHIVFNEGKYQPGSGEGKHLLAHELTHVMQQNEKDVGRVIQRKTPKKSPPKISATAAGAPKLTGQFSKNGPACACLIVIHNNEQNALLTAKTIYENCNYNLLLLTPGSDRTTAIPGNGAVDPNGLFPPAIAEKCTNSPADCEKFLKDKAGSTNPAEILEQVQIQYFMEVSKFSNGFSIPVVALHNNSIGDTSKYRKKKDSVDLADLEKDIDKDKTTETNNPVENMKTWLDKKFKVKGDPAKGPGAVRNQLMTSKLTNIFLWCASADINKCHIGDPKNPDRVIWVTNETDFKTLKTKDVNVAFQSEVPKDPASNSLTDLSTLFPALKNIYGSKLNEVMELIKSYPVIELGEEAAVLEKMIQDLRFVNIETPGHKIAAQTDAERVNNFEFIADVLRSLGIYCCEKANEEKIKNTLKVQEAKEAAKKAKAKK